MSVHALKPAATPNRIGQLTDIYYAARTLAEAALVSRTLPRYPELHDLTDSRDKALEEAIKHMQEAING